MYEPAASTVAGGKQYCSPSKHQPETSTPAAPWLYSSMNSSPFDSLDGWYISSLITTSPDQAGSNEPLKSSTARIKYL